MIKYIYLKKSWISSSSSSSSSNWNHSLCGKDTWGCWERHEISPPVWYVSPSHFQPIMSQYHITLVVLFLSDSVNIVRDLSLYEIPCLPGKCVCWGRGRGAGWGLKDVKMCIVIGHRSLGKLSFC